MFIVALYYKTTPKLRLSASVQLYSPVPELLDGYAATLINSSFPTLYMMYQFFEHIFSFLPHSAMFPPSPTKVYF